MTSGSPRRVNCSRIRPKVSGSSSCIAPRTLPGALRTGEPLPVALRTGEHRAGAHVVAGAGNPAQPGREVLGTGGTMGQVALDGVALQLAQQRERLLVLHALRD